MATDNVPMLPEPDPELPLYVLVIDEVTDYLEGDTEAGEDAQFGELLADIMRQGRASSYPFYTSTPYLCECREPLHGLRYTSCNNTEEQLPEPTEAVCTRCGFRAPYEQVQRTARAAIPTQRLTADALPEGFQYKLADGGRIPGSRRGPITPIGGF